ncbi:hypothetical protein SBOR_7586 [Sclerotinia borealis F-4128]|uniref:Uncharacterized protein n=1 Tax=Sclerotinia borealis (strain F-4128) TaxID=1432307 RepID=W9CBS8_SCLBF|nr:hypothetical protein SBOR_7586 [Sclerotinia borealis F-4128]
MAANYVRSITFFRITAKQCNLTDIVADISTNVDLWEERYANAHHILFHNRSQSSHGFRELNVVSEAAAINVVGDSELSCVKAELQEPEWKDYRDDVDTMTKTGTVSNTSWLIKYVMSSIASLLSEIPFEAWRIEFFPILRRILFRTAIVLVVGWFLAYLYGVVISAIMGFMEQLPGGSIVNWIVQWCSSLLPWNWNISLTGLTNAASYITKSSFFRITPLNHIISSTTTLWAALQNLFGYTPTHRNASIEIPHSIIKDYALEAANNTFGLLNLTMNISALPILLSHSHKSIIGASEIVRASQLKDKYDMSRAYTELEKGNAELRLKLIGHTEGVPDLIKQFETSLSIAISETDNIRLDTSLQNSVLLKSSAVCIILWHIPGLEIASWRWINSPCWASFLGSGSVIACLEGDYPWCPSLLAHTTIVTSHMNETQKTRALTARRLRRLVETLQTDLGELLHDAQQAISICENLNLNFERINRFKEANQKEGEKEVPPVPVDVNKVPDTHILDGFLHDVRRSRSATEDSKKKRIWGIDMERLEVIHHFHHLAHEYFLQAEQRITHWDSKINAEDLLRQLKKLEASADEDWRYDLNEEKAWAQIRGDLQSLIPLVTKFSAAFTKQGRVRSQVDDVVSARAKKCYRERKANRGKDESSARSWEDCFFEGFTFEKTFRVNGEGRVGMSYKMLILQADSVF